MKSYFLSCSLTSFPRAACCAIYYGLAFLLVTTLSSQPDVLNVEERESGVTFKAVNIFYRIIHYNTTYKKESHIYAKRTC